MFYSEVAEKENSIEENFYLRQKLVNIIKTNTKKCSLHTL